MLTIATVMLAAAGASASAQRSGPPPGGRGGRGGPGGPGGRCAATPDSLTDTQKGQVRELGMAFTAAHTAQLDSLRAIMDASRAARQAGKSQDEIRAIMESGRPIVEALAPARRDFSQAVQKLMTPEQIAAGCIPPAPGGPMGGRRGGPPPELLQ
jgi:Spy/CpxP family protein refolding chaperone